MNEVESLTKQRGFTVKSTLHCYSIYVFIFLVIGLFSLFGLAIYLTLKTKHLEEKVYYQDEAINSLKLQVEFLKEHVNFDTEVSLTEVGNAEIVYSRNKRRANNKKKNGSKKQNRNKKRKRKDEEILSRKEVTIQLEKTINKHLKKIQISTLVEDKVEIHVKKHLSKKYIKNVVNSTVTNELRAIVTDLVNGKDERQAAPAMHILISAHMSQPQSPDLLTGQQGEVIPHWKLPDDDYSRTVTFAKFNPNGTVTVLETGVYHIYSQMTYYDRTGRWAHAIHVGERDFVKCLGSEWGLGTDPDTNQYFKTVHQCYTSGTKKITAGEQVSIVSMYADRVIHAQEEMSFWGIIRLS